MAKRTGTITDEYIGTGNDSGEPISGPSEPINPDDASGNIGANGTEFDARIHVGPDVRNGDGSFTKRRGRKSGGNNSGANRTGKTASAADLKFALDGLTKTLVIIHMGVAGVTNTPELMIDENEAEYLARSTANVLEQFDMKPDPKIQAIIGLIIAAGTVYGPRAYMIKSRHAAEARERPANAKGFGTASVLNPDGTNMGTEFKIDPRPPMTN